MTPLEKRLARRIHNQRRRLRQLDEFLMWRREHQIWSRSKWLHMACKLLRENDDLRKQLGIKERFGQLNSLEDHIP